jgi:hypothetical protein
MSIVQSPSSCAPFSNFPSDFFNHELIRLLGKDLQRWEANDHQGVMKKAPSSLAIAVLKNFVGENDRGTDNFATQMHAVADALVCQLARVGAPKAREEVLHDVCCVLVYRGWLQSHRGAIDSHIQYVSGWPDTKWRMDFSQGINTEAATKCIVFLVAAVTRRIEVVRAMLTRFYTGEKEGTSSVEDEPVENVDTAMKVSMCLYQGSSNILVFDAGALWENVWRNTHWWSTAMKGVIDQAAARGHLDIIELLLSKLPESMGKRRFAAGVVSHGAMNMHWGMIRHILRQYAWQLQPKDDICHYLRTIIWCASKDRQADVLYTVLPELSKFVDIYPRYLDGMLRDAVGRGYLDICHILLNHGALKDARYEQSEVLARCVAKGGNIEIYKLLKERNLWKPWHEVHFIPVAVENGHLEFAKFAWRNGCDPALRLADKIPPMAIKLDSRRDYLGKLMYFTLLRAVVTGQLNMARWLIEELKVAVLQPEVFECPELAPIELAIDSGGVGMVELFLAHGADRVHVQFEGFGHICARKARSEHLDFVRKMLFLGKDFDTDSYYRGPEDKRLAAFSEGSHADSQAYSRLAYDRK